MNWNNIVEKISEFWNKPIPIIGFTVGALLIAILTIIAKTSFGKKAINWCKSKIALLEEMFKQAKKEHEAIIKEKDEIIDKMKQEFKDQLAVIEYNRDLERQFIIDALSQINNIKVKKLLEEYIKTIKPVTISEVVENIHNEYESKYTELLARLEELENEKGKDSDTVKEEI